MLRPGAKVAGLIDCDRARRLYRDHLRGIGRHGVLLVAAHPGAGPSATSAPAPPGEPWPPAQMNSDSIVLRPGFCRSRLTPT